MLRDSIKRHMRTVHKETKECEEKTQIDEFISKSFLIKERAHLKKEENEKICLLMETAHLKREEREKISPLMIVECPECGKTVTKKHLKRHKETSHLKLKRKQPLGQCKECGKNLLRDSIERHMRTVHKETK